MFPIYNIVTNKFQCFYFFIIWCLLDILDIERMRKLIENMIQKYSLDAKCNNDKRLISNCSDFCEVNEIIQSKVRHKFN